MSQKNKQNGSSEMSDFNLVIFVIIIMLYSDIDYPYLFVYCFYCIPVICYILYVFCVLHCIIRIACTGELNVQTMIENLSLNIYNANGKELILTILLWIV